jgi:GH24 family phage-related lysozyme (muramidase)
MSLIDPTVRAGFLAFNAPFEGDVRTMYRDEKGLVTTAAGYLINSPAAACAIPWSHFDGSSASSAEVVAEWERVDAMPADLVWTHYAAGATVRLSDDAIEQITLARLDADVVIFVRAFPDFASWPTDAQLAAASMMWAMGAEFYLSWPKWSASARAQDWLACAANCEINPGPLLPNGKHTNEGVVPRSAKQKALFLEAAAEVADTHPIA